MAWILAVVYGWLLLTALSNRLLMVRPRPSSSAPNFCILIPARNEAENLRQLLPSLQGVKIYVFDDESSDGSAEVAASLEATVIRGGPLEAGWTGKNRACHELAKVAAEDSSAEWLLFLDADMRASPSFVGAVQGLVETVGRRASVISGFPRMIPGRGFEPMYTSWVPWILLATNPFGLVSRTGKGHNRFTNGQFTLWRASTYWELMPNQTLKDRILEDVLIGRMLARQGVRTEVVDMSPYLATRMYGTLRKGLDGMSKNSYEIMGGMVGTVAMAVVLLHVGWGWVLGGIWAFWLAVALVLGKFMTDFQTYFSSSPLPLPHPRSSAAERSHGTDLWAQERAALTWLWVALFMPVTATLASFTFLRSAIWHHRGEVHWKGRTYPSKVGKE